jgi:DNA-binding transcriptional LysR family regulator
MPNLRQIRYFLTIAEHGGFTPAASILCVAQPALSRQIALLEEELGFSLFKREPRGVSLTQAGAHFRERVANLEQSLLDAAEESRQLNSGEAGVLRLLHSSSLPVDYFLPAIRQFSLAAPRARIDLDRISSEQQIMEIAGGKADIGLIRLPILRRDPAVRFIELPAERLWVAMPQTHRLTTRESLKLAELAEEPFVSAVHRERGGLARCVTNLCLSRGFVPRLAPVISRKTSMLTLVGAAFGIAVVPECMTQTEIPGVTYKALLDNDAVSNGAVVLPLDSTALAQRFMEILRETFSIEENPEQKKADL